MGKLFLALALFGLPLSAVAQTASTTQDTPYKAEILTHEQTQDENDQPVDVYTVRFLEGPENRKTVTIGDNEGASSIGYTEFKPGAVVYVTIIKHIDGTNRYLILDHSRQGSLWWLVALFVAAVVALSRWHGVRSLIGLAISFGVIIGWIVPMIAKGHSPVWVTLLGGAVVLVVSFILTEGWNRRSWAAGLGTTVTMILIGLLSRWAIGFSQLTGNNSEEAFFLQSIGSNIDVRGLLLAGIIIGTLGILDDIAISQVATVAELRAANKDMKPLALYQAAMRVGRSHLAAIVNTLVLAYAGTSLPLLVLFHQGAQPVKFILNGELVASEIVRSVIGSIGLVLAVPITTAVAVWLKVESGHKHQGHSH